MEPPEALHVPGANHRDQDTGKSRTKRQEQDVNVVAQPAAVRAWSKPGAGVSGFLPGVIGRLDSLFGHATGDIARGDDTKHCGSSRVLWPRG